MATTTRPAKRSDYAAPTAPNSVVWCRGMSVPVAGLSLKGHDSFKELRTRQTSTMPQFANQAIAVLKQARRREHSETRDDLVRTPRWSSLMEASPLVPSANHSWKHRTARAMPLESWTLYGTPCQGRGLHPPRRLISSTPKTKNRPHASTSTRSTGVAGYSSPQSVMSAR